jgi:hypothetical protein
MHERPAVRMRLWVVLIIVVLLPAGYARTAASPAPPSRIHLYVVVPADQQVDYGIADAALHETELAMTWIEGEVGRTLDRRPAQFAEIVTLPHPSADLLTDPSSAFAMIHEVVVAHVDDASVFPVILADLSTAGPRPGMLTCGLGGTAGVVMFLDNCPGTGLSATSAWGSAASVTIAHEIVHGLGAVDDCAPHSSGDGHVTDDPLDILYARTSARVPGQPVTLDAGRDDYLRHAVPGCLDIDDSPLWVR